MDQNILIINPDNEHINGHDQENTISEIIEIKESSDTEIDEDVDIYDNLKNDIISHIFKNRLECDYIHQNHILILHDLYFNDLVIPFECLNSVDLIYHMGLYHHIKHDFDRSIKYLKWCSDLGNSDAFNIMGNHYYHHGETVLAVESFLSAIQLENFKFVSVLLDIYQIHYRYFDIFRLIIHGIKYMNRICISYLQKHIAKKTDIYACYLEFINQNNQHIASDYCTACYTKYSPLKSIKLRCGHVCCMECIIDLFKRSETIKCISCHAYIN